MPLHYTQGDATSPQSSGNKLIIHICNDKGAWGKGFVMALSKKWSGPEEEYRGWYTSKENFGLGEVQIVQVEPEVWVGNMVAQKGFQFQPDGTPPLQYEALTRCLQQVANIALGNQCSIHLPRIGTGIAGGRWKKIEPLLIRELSDKGLEVIVYDFAR